jgi:hypothetical protein
MRILAITAIITSLVVPAFAALAVSSFAAEDPSKEEQYRFEEQKKKEAQEIEREYKDTLKRMNREQPGQKSDRYDPWRNSR